MYQKRVTLRDIAAKAGVHVTTVSLALRNHPRIPESTRLRIKNLAQSMGYQPDPMLKALAEYRDQTRTDHKAMTFAYLTWWDSPLGWKHVTEDPPFRLMLYNGARQRAEQLGISLDHFSLAEPGMTVRRLDQILRSRGIQGVIASSFMDRACSLPLNWSYYAHVKIDNSPIDTPVHKVRSDVIAAVQGNYCKARKYGYKRIGLAIRQIWNDKNDDLILMGFLRSQALDPGEKAIPPFVHNAVEPVEAFAEWYAVNQPDVVISLDPFLLPMANHCGIRIPDDLAYLSFDNKDETGHIAGYHQRHQAVGAAAVDFVTAMIHRNEFGLPDLPQTLSIPPVWIGGRSLPIRR